MDQQSQSPTSLTSCLRQTNVVYYYLPLFVVLCLLSACGQSAVVSTPKEQGATNVPGLLPNIAFDPCALFAKSDAAAVLGGVVTMKADTVAPICRYEKAGAVSAKGPGDIGGTPVSRNVLIVSIGTSQDTRQYLALDRVSASSQSQVQDVKGMGDGAFAVTFAGGNGLIVARGNTILSLGVFYPALASAKVLSGLEHLAQSALHTISVGTHTLPAPKPHPCALITANEASTLLQDEPVKWFFTTNNAGSSNCDYITPQGMQHRVVIGLTTGTDARSASSLYNSARQSMEKSQGHDMNNLGDAAFYDGQNTIWILKGNMVLHMTPFGSSVLETSALSLLRNAIARL